MSGKFDLGESLVDMVESGYSVGLMLNGGPQLMNCCNLMLKERKTRRGSERERSSDELDRLAGDIEKRSSDKLDHLERHEKERSRERTERERASDELDRLASHIEKRSSDKLDHLESLQDQHESDHRRKDLTGRKRRDELNDQN